MSLRKALVAALGTTVVACGSSSSSPTDQPDGGQGDPTPVTLLYTGTVRGNLEPCG
jgi:hypothetical protein